MWRTSATPEHAAPAPPSTLEARTGLRVRSALPPRSRDRQGEAVHADRMPAALELPPHEPGPFAPCPLLLDTSDSMSVGNAIGQLNDALVQFEQEIKQDKLAPHRADISVIEIKTHAELVVPPTLG